MGKLDNRVKGCAFYGINSIHPCFCSPFSNKEKVIKIFKREPKKKQFKLIK